MGPNLVLILVGVLAQLTGTSQDTNAPCLGRPNSSLPDFHRCDSYIECFSGVAFHRRCPLGTQFNPNSLRCDISMTPLCAQQVENTKNLWTQGTQNGLLSKDVTRTTGRVPYTPYGSIPGQVEKRRLLFTDGGSNTHVSRPDTPSYNGNAPQPVQLYTANGKDVISQGNIEGQSRVIRVLVPWYLRVPISATHEKKTFRTDNAHRANLYSTEPVTQQKYQGENGNIARKEDTARLTRFTAPQRGGNVNDRVGFPAPYVLDFSNPESKAIFAKFEAEIDEEMRQWKNGMLAKQSKSDGTFPSIGPQAGGNTGTEFLLGSPPNSRSTPNGAQINQIGVSPHVPLGRTNGKTVHNQKDLYWTALGGKQLPNLYIPQQHSPILQSLTTQHSTAQIHGKQGIRPNVQPLSYDSRTLLTMAQPFVTEDRPGGTDSRSTRIQYFPQSSTKSTYPDSTMIQSQRSPPNVPYEESSQGPRAHTVSNFREFFGILPKHLSSPVVKDQSGMNGFHRFNTGAGMGGQILYDFTDNRVVQTHGPSESQGKRNLGSNDIISSYSNYPLDNKINSERDNFNDYFRYSLGPSGSTHQQATNNVDYIERENIAFPQYRNNEGHTQPYHDPKGEVYGDKYQDSTYYHPSAEGHVGQHSYSTGGKHGQKSAKPSHYLDIEHYSSVQDLSGQPYSNRYQDPEDRYHKQQFSSEKRGYGKDSHLSEGNNGYNMNHDDVPRRREHSAKNVQQQQRYNSNSYAPQQRSNGDQDHLDYSAGNNGGSYPTESKDYYTDRYGSSDDRRDNRGTREQDSETQGQRYSSDSYAPQQKRQSDDRKGWRRQNYNRDSPYQRRRPGPDNDDRYRDDKKKGRDSKDKKDEPERDGDHEHHGRKPPDFGNFPYTFLPKHLTGPLFSDGNTGFGGFGGTGGVSGFGGVKNVGLDDNGEVQYDFTDNRVAGPSTPTDKTTSPPKDHDKNLLVGEKGTSTSPNTSAIVKNRKKRSSGRYSYSQSSARPKTYANHLYYSQDQSPRSRHPYQVRYGGGTSGNGNRYTPAATYIDYQDNHRARPERDEDYHNRPAHSHRSSIPTRQSATHQVYTAHPQGRDAGVVWRSGREGLVTDYAPERYAPQAQAYSREDGGLPQRYYGSAGERSSSQGHNVRYYDGDREYNTQNQGQYSDRSHDKKMSDSPKYSEGGYYSEGYAPQTHDSQDGRYSGSNQGNSYSPRQRYHSNGDQGHIDYSAGNNGGSYPTESKDYYTDRYGSSDDRRDNRGTREQDSETQGQRYSSDSYAPQEKRQSDDRKGQRQQNYNRDSPYQRRRPGPDNDDRYRDDKKKGRDSKDKKDEPERDGDHEHHGRKPPDFGNFPYTFLPKHLTGPLFSDGNTGFGGFGGTGGVSGFGGVKNVGLDDNGEVQYDFTDNRVAGPSTPTDKTTSPPKDHDKNLLVGEKGTSTSPNTSAIVKNRKKRSSGRYSYSQSSARPKTYANHLYYSQDQSPRSRHPYQVRYGGGTSGNGNRYTPAATYIDYQDNHRARPERDEDYHNRPAHSHRSSIPTRQSSTHQVYTAHPQGRDAGVVWRSGREGLVTDYAPERYAPQAQAYSREDGGLPQRYYGSAGERSSSQGHNVRYYDGDREYNTQNQGQYSDRSHDKKMSDSPKYSEGGYYSEGYAPQTHDSQDGRYSGSNQGNSYSPRQRYHSNGDQGHIDYSAGNNGGSYPTESKDYYTDRYGSSDDRRDNRGTREQDSETQGQRYSSDSYAPQEKRQSDDRKGQHQQNYNRDSPYQRRRPGPDNDDRYRDDKKKGRDSKDKKDEPERDGDHEHHGRKPPDFGNFPYTFLPKHLTGPLFSDGNTGFGGFGGTGGVSGFGGVKNVGLDDNGEVQYDFTDNRVAGPSTPTDKTTSPPKDHDKNLLVGEKGTSTSPNTSAIVKNRKKRSSGRYSYSQSSARPKTYANHLYYSQDQSPRSRHPYQVRYGGGTSGNGNRYTPAATYIDYQNNHRARPERDEDYHNRPAHSHRSSIPTRQSSTHQVYTAHPQGRDAGVVWRSGREGLVTDYAPERYAPQAQAYSREDGGLPQRYYGSEGERPSSQGHNVRYYDGDREYNTQNQGQYSDRSHDKKMSDSPKYSEGGYYSEGYAPQTHDSQDGRYSGSNQGNSYSPRQRYHSNGDQDHIDYSAGNNGGSYPTESKDYYTDRHDSSDDRHDNRGTREQDSETQGQRYSSDSYAPQQKRQSDDRKGQRRQNSNRDSPYQRRRPGPDNGNRYRDDKQKGRDSKDKKDEPERDGDHEHHGRKPPDFANFPYTFLPKHLTGPLFSDGNTGFGGFGGTGGVSGFGGVKNVGLDDNGEVQYDFTDNRVAGPSTPTDKTTSPQKDHDKNLLVGEKGTSTSPNTSAIVKNRKKRSSGRYSYSQSSARPKTYANHLYYSQDQSPRSRHPYQVRYGGGTSGNGNRYTPTATYIDYQNNHRARPERDEDYHNRPAHSHRSSIPTRQSSTHQVYTAHPQGRDAGVVWRSGREGLVRDYAPERYAPRAQAYSREDGGLPHRYYGSEGERPSSQGHNGRYYDGDREYNTQNQGQYSDRLHDEKMSDYPKHSEGGYYSEGYAPQTHDSQDGRYSGSNQGNSYSPRQRYHSNGDQGHIDYSAGNNGGSYPTESKEYYTDRYGSSDDRHDNRGTREQDSETQGQRYSSDSYAPQQKRQSDDRKGQRRQNSNRDSPYQRRRPGPDNDDRYRDDKKKGRDSKDKKDEPERDGDHEHHGRKPPDFGNFPYTFLPKHLTGPLFSDGNTGFGGFGGTGGVSGFGGVKNVGLDDNGEVQYDFTDNRVAGPSTPTDKTTSPQKDHDKNLLVGEKGTSTSPNTSAIVKNRKKRSSGRYSYSQSSARPKTYANHLYYSQDQSPRSRHPYQVRYGGGTSGNGNRYTPTATSLDYQDNHRARPERDEDYHNRPAHSHRSSIPTRQSSTHQVYTARPQGRDAGVVWRSGREGIVRDYAPERYAPQAQAYSREDGGLPQRYYGSEGERSSSQGHNVRYYDGDREYNTHNQGQYSDRSHDEKMSDYPKYSEGGYYSEGYAPQTHDSQDGRYSGSNQGNSYSPRQRYHSNGDQGHIDYSAGNNGGSYPTESKDYYTDRYGSSDDRHDNRGTREQDSETQGQRYNSDSYAPQQKRQSDDRKGQRQQNYNRDSPYQRRRPGPDNGNRYRDDKKKGRDSKDKKDEPERDGDHEHHGRKPPDFGNFPYTFLPKHLTGPLFSDGNTGFGGFGGTGGVSGFGGVKNVGLDDNGEVQYDFTDNRVAPDKNSNVSAAKNSTKEENTGSVTKKVDLQLHPPTTAGQTATSATRSRSRRSPTSDTVHSRNIGETHEGTKTQWMKYNRGYLVGGKSSASGDKQTLQPHTQVQNDPFGVPMSHGFESYDSLHGETPALFSYPKETFSNPRNDFLYAKAVHDQQYAETIHGFGESQDSTLLTPQMDSKMGRSEYLENPGEDLNMYDGFHLAPGRTIHGRSGFQTGRDGHSVLKEAVQIVRERMRGDTTMAHKMHNVVDSGPYRYVTAFLYAKPYAKYLSYAGRTLLQATHLINERYGSHIDAPVSLRHMPHAGLPDARMEVPPDIDFCPYPSDFICEGDFKYRTADGSCNNLAEPLWGRSMTPHRRLLPAVYGDGVESMRHSVGGGPLPGARLISLHSFPDVNRPSEMHTLLLMIWGQFLDHDVTRTAISMASMDEGGFGGTADVKCGFDGCDTHGPGLEACWPIPVPIDDPDFAFTNHCLKFVRSQEVPPLHCKTGNRETLNQVTQWIDGSQIYGSTPEEAAAIRDYSDPGRGWMAMTRHPAGPQWKDLLPQDDVALCRGTNRTVRCFLAGDERVNEQSGLTAMHTTWVRQHNRIEAELHHLNPHWDGERIYQETRKIIGAMIQHVVFNEQLPLILGTDVMRRYGLELERDGFYHGYDPSYDPRVSQAFGSAAYRFGHTLIQDRFRRSSYDHFADDSLMLSETFRRPVHIYDTSRGGVDSLLRGLCDYASQTYDRFFTKQITRSLFTEHPPFGVGMDLLSLNIQRGRDHGIAGYNTYREFCGLGRASDFEDLSREIPDPTSRSILRSLYKHVDDIDLFPGGVAERSVGGGVVGPTFACIIANQLQHARKGDRFWYENDHRHGFTKEKLGEIRKIRLSRILCANGDSVDSIQPWAMLKPFREAFQHMGYGSYDDQKTGMPHEDFAKLYEENFNARVPCAHLPDLNLNYWREGPFTH